MSDVLAIRASNNGRLQLSIRTDSVTVETLWTNCTNPQMGGSSTMSFSDWLTTCLLLCCYSTISVSRRRGWYKWKPDPDHLFAVVISIRSFLKFLNSHVVSTTTIACWFIPCLCDRNDLLIVFLFRHMSKSLHDPLRLYRRRRRRGWGVNVLYSYHRRRRPLVLEIVLRLPLVSIYLFFPSSWVISECCLLSWIDWFCRNVRSFHFWRYVSPYSD